MKTLLNKKTFIIAMVLVVSIAFAGFAEEALYIDAYGNVGIGTTEPGAILEVHNPSWGLSVTIDGNGLNFNRNNNSYICQQNTSGRLRIGVGDISYEHDGITIINGGNVGIGTMFPSAELEVNGTIRASKFEARGGPLQMSGSGWGVDILLDVDGGSNDSFVIKDTGVNKLILNGNTGNLWLAGTCPQASDLRYKKNITTIPNALDKITQIQGVNFNWKGTDRDPSLQMGLIAQDVEKVFPELVCTDENGYKSVCYSNMIAALVESVKELKTQNDELQSELASLTGNNIQQKSLWDKITGIFN